MLSSCFIVCGSFSSSKDSVKNYDDFCCLWAAIASVYRNLRNSVRATGFLPIDKSISSIKEDWERENGERENRNCFVCNFHLDLLQMTK